MFSASSITVYASPSKRASSTARPKFDASAFSISNSTMPNDRSWAPGFNAPISQACSVSTQPPPPRKSKSRRKRHVPPGPAGVWYQAKQHAGSDDASAEEEDKTTPDHSPAPDVTICPAWMCMQLQLPLLTPYLPPYATIPQRHQELRKILPEDYTLIPEITGLVLSHRLLVLVHAVQSHSSCDWTVELHDETGSSMYAWIAPSLVLKENEQPDKVRAGVVWCLQGVSILPSASSKWLLVHEASIIKYWTAPKEVSNQVYLQWMEKRNALPSSFQGQSNLRAAIQEDEEEEMEVEIELPMSTVPRPCAMPQNDDDENVLPADFGLQVLPFLHPPTQQTQQHPPTLTQTPRPVSSVTQKTVIPIQSPPSTTAASATIPDFSQYAANPYSTASIPASSQVRENPYASRRQETQQSDHSQSQQPTVPILQSRPSAPAASSQSQVTASIPASSQVRVNPYASRRQEIQQSDHSQCEEPTVPISRSRPSGPAASTQSQVIASISASSQVRVNPYASRRQQETQQSDHSQREQPTVPIQQSRSSGPATTSQSQVQLFPYSSKSQESQHSVQRQQPTETNTHPSPKQPTPSSEQASMTPPPKHQSSKPSSAKKRQNSNPLAQFAARTSPKQTNKENKSPIVVASQSSPKPSRKKKSPKRDQASAISNLFSASTAMMGMFDDDDDEEDTLVPPPPAKVNSEPNSPSRETTHESPTLFQASNFAGMMGMFDDDDE